MNRPFTQSLIILILGAPLAANPRATAGEDAAAEATGLFKTYCYDCHGDGARKGGLALDELLKPGKGEGRLEWESVWKIVRHEFMPPADADRPSDDERREMTRWIERQVFHVEASKPDPGRVTIRRLNRMEYHYTVRDLFGIELDLARELPPDDTAFGFDNIGDALTLSPALLETYLKLAEKVVESVVVTDGPRHPRVDLSPPQFKATAPDEKGRLQQTAQVELKHSGRYRVEVQFRLGDFRATTGDYLFQMTMGGTKLAEQVVSDGGEKTYVLAGEVELPAGTHALALSTEPTPPVAGGDRPRSLTLFPRAMVVGPLGSNIFDVPEPHRRIFFNGPAPEDPAARRAYAKSVIRRVADRAFRRPATDEAIERLADVALEGGSFEVGIARALTAILGSPRFFYRAELQAHPDDPAEVQPLDEYALASRLSYLLWLSLPDDELSRLAAEGRLRAELPGQLRRMLADPRSGRFFEDFAGQWLRTRNILHTPMTSRDSARVTPVRPAMKRETEMLFEYIAREGRDLVELLTADYTFLNEKLARHYGIDGVSGDEMRRVPLPPESHRQGVLTHGGLLISTSNPGRTSPVKRGVFVLENLLGKEVPPPPPNVAPLEDERRGGFRSRTLREQLAAHREQASCASCHNRFDPIGLALENFDQLGVFRERERNGQPVDATAKLVTGEAISGAAELGRALASRPEAFYRCVAEKLLTYALGRGLEPSDAPTLDAITARTKAEHGAFPAMLTAVVESAPFQSRRGDGGEAAAQARTARMQPPPPERRGAAGRSMVEAARRAAAGEQAKNQAEPEEAEAERPAGAEVEGRP
ncbi:DUF1592 domain-containing protein [Paludisphaera rhizosphaerae]|uniref:DUF1592 domain-containing protein n=1 Tax=Paludisphaera rhizosphaerae TaxID=2711216 RepID=UPI0013ECD366|nr:DUF1592 domain-containing protein [Paludisphaera rhizosphaerae]